MIKAIKYLGFLSCFLACSVPARSVSPGSWVEQEGFRFKEIPLNPSGRSGFTSMPSEVTSVGFSNSLSLEDQGKNNNLLNGSGVALGDVDGDGWCDIYFAALNGSGRLYRNLGGWKFEDITRQAGLYAEDQMIAGALIADFTGDGFRDLVLSYSAQSPRLFINDGSGRFPEQRSLTDRPVRLGGTTVAAADMDLDGDLDLYVANYGESTIRSASKVSVRMVNGQPVVGGRFRNRIKIIDDQLVEYGEPDHLFMNNGRGQFSELDWLSGRFLNENDLPLPEPIRDFSLSAMFRDVNRDGLPDLYVCSDFYTPDRFWINQGDGVFRLLPRHAQLVSSQFSMGIDFADVNRDGRDDFFIADMLSRFHRYRLTQTLSDVASINRTLEPRLDRPQAQRNTLFVGQGEGGFVETALYAGLAASDWSWCPVFLDVDLDGYEDLLVTNGHAHEPLDPDERKRDPDQIQKEAALQNRTFNYPPLRIPNAAFRNMGGLRFKEVSEAWGFDSLDLSMGMACGDLDNDGDLDLAINTLNAKALLYRNESTRSRVAVRLRSTGPNRDGIGARVELSNSRLSQAQEIIAGGRYLSHDQPMRVFAFEAGLDHVLTVHWLGGGISRIETIQPNRIYEIDQPTSSRLKPEGSDEKGSTESSLFRAAEILVESEFEEKKHRSLPLPIHLEAGLKKEVDRLTWPHIKGVLLDNHMIGGVMGWRRNMLNDPSNQVLNTLGLWTDFELFDMDSDGDLDILAACLWDGLKLFENKAGQWVDQSDSFGFGDKPGLWLSLHVRDLDADGRPDIVAGNWGLNSSYSLFGTAPIRLAYRLDAVPGQVSFLESYLDSDSGTWLPVQDLEFFRSMFPSASLRFPSHELYASASSQDLFDGPDGPTGALEIHLLESGVFYRRDSGFHFQSLPMEAQWTPVLDVDSGDLNGDGLIDLVLAQNFSRLPKKEAPMKAHGALVLLNSGDQDFRALSRTESGIFFSEDAQSIHVKDWDGDERLDVLVKTEGDLLLFQHK